MPARISIVVASRGRPFELRRCLDGLAQAVWPLVEVVVVTDRAGCEAAAGRSGIAVVAFDEPNLAAARNAGLRATGGDIVAFIDDDAVPEPMWLAALAEAFDDASVGAATGPVLGRNGISLQSAAETILSDATTVPSTGDPAVRRASPGRAPKTVGANMAFRADLIRAAGGFDETFRFFLEDADLDMRLGEMGVITAYAADAVVHHGSAASPRRRSDRAPIELFDIGRSTAAFLLRHHPAARVREALDAARARELARAVRGLQGGALEPRDLRRLMAGFDAGAREGLEAGGPQLARFGPTPPFGPRPVSRARHAIVAGTGRQRSAARAKAEALRDSGATVSLFLFSPTTLYHHVRHDGGMWVQTGGLWGRSDRSGPLVRQAGLGSRLDEEVARVARPRGLDSRRNAELLPRQTIHVERFPFP